MRVRIKSIEKSLKFGFERRSLGSSYRFRRFRAPGRDTLRDSCELICKLPRGQKVGRHRVERAGRKGTLASGTGDLLVEDFVLLFTTWHVCFTTFYCFTIFSLKSTTKKRLIRGPVQCVRQFARCTGPLRGPGRQSRKDVESKIEFDAKRAPDRCVPSHPNQRRRSHLGNPKYSPPTVTRHPLAV